MNSCSNCLRVSTLWMVMVKSAEMPIQEQDPTQQDPPLQECQFPGQSSYPPWKNHPAAEDMEQLVLDMASSLEMSLDSFTTASSTSEGTESTEGFGISDIAVDNSYNKHIPILTTLHDGTLLGAVRHGGVIPFDEDVDITLYVCSEMSSEISETPSQSAPTSSEACTDLIQKRADVGATDFALYFWSSVLFPRLEENGLFSLKSSDAYTAHGDDEASLIAQYSGKKSGMSIPIDVKIVLGGKKPERCLCRVGVVGETGNANVGTVGSTRIGTGIVGTERTTERTDAEKTNTGENGQGDRKLLPLCTLNAEAMLADEYGPLWRFPMSQNTYYETDTRGGDFVPKLWNRKEEGARWADEIEPVVLGKGGGKRASTSTIQNQKVTGSPDHACSLPTWVISEQVIGRCSEDVQRRWREGRWDPSTGRSKRKPFVSAMRVTPASRWTGWVVVSFPVVVCGILYARIFVRSILRIWRKRKDH